MATRKAIGIVRVSETRGSDGASPPEQRARIESECERRGLRLVETIEELDVSGGTPLEKRRGLRRGVEAVEAGEVEVIVAAYFDRLVRSLKVQAEVVERVEAAGGEVLAVDVGRVTNGSAGQWLSSTMLGAVSEYHRRTTAERTAEAQAQAIARGIPPCPGSPPGYRRIDNGPLEPDPTDAPIAAKAWDMRANGAPIEEARQFMREHGIERSFGAIQRWFASDIVLGVLRFGKHVNLSAHPAIVDVDTWRRVQRVRIPRGRKAKSDRLLARLGVLRCASCGARMVVGRSGKTGAYRCPETGDCPRRAAINAPLIEGIVTNSVRAALAGVEGKASAERNTREAAAALERAQADLDAAIRVLADLADEQAAREKLAELRGIRDDAQAHLDQLGGLRATVTINAADDWDRLSLDARRALIRATVARVLVAPGRGADRVTVELVGE